MVNVSTVEDLKCLNTPNSSLEGAIELKLRHSALLEMLFLMVSLSPNLLDSQKSNVRSVDAWLPFKCTHMVNVVKVKTFVTPHSKVLCT